MYIKALVLGKLCTHDGGFFGRGRNEVLSFCYLLYIFCVYLKCSFTLP